MQQASEAPTRRRQRQCFEGDDEVFVVIDETTDAVLFFGVARGADIDAIRQDVTGREHPYAANGTTGYRIVREPMAFLQRYKPGDIVTGVKREAVPAVPAKAGALAARQLMSYGEGS